MHFNNELINLVASTFCTFKSTVWSHAAVAVVLCLKSDRAIVYIGACTQCGLLYQLHIIAVIVVIIMVSNTAVYVN